MGSEVPADAGNWLVDRKCDAPPIERLTHCCMRAARSVRMSADTDGGACCCSAPRFNAQAALPPTAQTRNATSRSRFRIVGMFGGAERDRTDDLLSAIQALSQLSYSPTFCCRLPLTTPRTSEFRGARIIGAGVRGRKVESIPTRASQPAGSRRSGRQACWSAGKWSAGRLRSYAGAAAARQPSISVFTCERSNGFGSMPVTSSWSTVLRRCSRPPVITKIFP
jgi:hypothetical protein